MRNIRLLFIITNCSVEPLGIMYLSSAVKKYGHIVDLYKFETEQKLWQYLNKFSPDVVAFSMTTGQHVELLQVAEYTKRFNKNIKIVVGGSHPTYFPKVEDLWFIDYIVRGEADHSFPKLINDLANGTIRKNKDCSELLLPNDLDKIHFPDRELLYKYPEYRNHPIKNVLSARGCPYSCAYCYNSVYRELYKGQKIVRYRSPRNIIEECYQIAEKYPVKMFFFADDEFSMDVNRLREIKDLYLRYIRLPFHCQVRIDLLDEKRVKILKEMGCYSLTFAIESGNENLRKELLGRNITNEQIIEGAKRLKQYKIKFRAENMVALPNETYLQMFETIDMNRKVKPDYAWVSLFQPYPNTVLGDKCVKEGLFDGKVDLIKERFTEDTVLKMSKEDKKKVVNLQRLFGLAVSFPVIRFLLPMLIKLNLTNFYTFLRDKWKLHRYWDRLFKCCRRKYGNQ